MARKVSRAARIKGLLRDIPSSKTSEAQQIAEEVLLLEDKLNEIYPEFASSPIVEEYDNGGGQMGTRENPLHSAYLKIYRSYSQSLRTLDEMREPPSAESELVELLRW